MALSGGAAEILWENSGDEEITVEKLIQRLQDRFGSDCQRSLHRALLSTRRQGANEPLECLIADVQRLLFLGYPGKMSEHVELIGIQAFLNSLNDRTLALR